MISPALSRQVARWIYRTNPSTSVRLAIMDATTDEELLEVVGLDATLSAAVASNGEPVAAASVWQSDDWGDVTAAPDFTDLAMVAVYPTAEQQQALAVQGKKNAEIMVL